MPPIDVRPPAQAEAERIWPSDREYTVAQTTAVFSVKELDAYCASAFTRGAHWAVGKLPSVQQIAAAFAEEGWTCEYHEPDPKCEQCKKLHLWSADAVLALIQKRYEEDHASN